MRKFWVIILFLFIASTSQEGYGFWIWSPKSKQWKNPQNSPLASPQAQLERAKQFYDAKEYDQAYKEFRKMIIHFPDSKEAPDAQYYLGKCLEGLDRPYQAFREYQKVVDSYPYSQRISEIVELEYKIGEYFLSRQQKKWMGISLDELFEHPSIEIFKKVVDNAPYSEPAQVSQYKLGILYKELARYEEAIGVFQELIEKYPESKWRDPAKYQLALCSAEASPASDYDQSLSREAEEKFKEFVAKNPEAEITKEAQEELKELRNKGAEKYFNTAEFYYKQREYQSAGVYYEYVIKNYPKTSWEEQAKARLETLKGAKK